MFSKKILSLYFLLFAVFSYADGDEGWTAPPPDPGFGGGTGDPATEPLATSIDATLLPLLIAAIIISFLVIHKRKNA